MVTLKSVEVINMAKQPNQSQSGTNIQQVRQQNAQSAAGAKVNSVQNLLVKQMFKK